MQDKLIIFDTTLRDGEQSPGASMTLDEKVRVAAQLEKMRVDVIEAGFPAASPGDFKAVQAVAETITDSTVCALARANAEDVERAAAAIAPAKRARIHTFIATSPIHMREKLRMDPEEVVQRAVAAVKLAREFTDDVEFSPEDAGRSELDFLCRILAAAIDAGAGTINIPDTVGYNLPPQFGHLIGELRQRVPNADKAVFSVHCHNDLGLAVANSLAAVAAGARQVECTVNGLGERAGNAALEEIVMAVRTRQDEFACDSGIDTTQIVPASRLVASITGFPVQPNKAIVGANAFAHEAGIHQDGVIKARETYEIMRAEEVGWATNRIVLGKHSGRRAFAERLKFLGHEFASAAQLADAFARFKKLADSKHEIFDDDLLALAADRATQSTGGRFALQSLEITARSGAPARAVAEISVAGAQQRAESHGNGAVDATFSAIEAIAHSGSVLQLYSVNAITAGSDAHGEVGVRLERGGRIVNGHGADLDIVTASAKAYINALNKLFVREDRVHPQHAAAV